MVLEVVLMTLKVSFEGFKMTPKAPQMAPKLHKTAPKMAPKVHAMGPTTSQMASNATSTVLIRLMVARSSMKLYLSWERVIGSNFL